MKIRFAMVLLCTFVALLSVRADYIRFDPETGRAVKMFGNPKRMTDVLVRAVPSKGIRPAGITNPSYPLVIPGMGSEAMLVRHMTTNITEVGINIAQIDPDNGEENPLVVSADFLRVSDYSSFVEKLHQMILVQAERGLLQPNYNPNWKLKVFFAANRTVYLGAGEVFYAVSFFGGGQSTAGDLVVTNGAVDFGSIQALNVQRSRDVGIQLPLHLETVRIHIVDQNGNELVSHDTAEVLDDREAYSFGRTLFIDGKWMIGSPDWTTEITLRFVGGQSLTYDGLGERVKLSIELVDGEPSIKVTGSMAPSESFNIQSSPSLNGTWTNLGSSDRKLQLAAPPVDARFFRIYQ